MPNDFIARVERFLNADFRYAILRNHNVRFELGRGGDADMLVADLTAAEGALRDNIGPPMFVVRRSYVTSFYYREGSFDMVEEISWRGASYLTPDALDETTRSDFGFWKLRAGHEAIVNLLSSILYGGFANPKYVSQIREARDTDGEAFLEALRFAVGRGMANRIVALIDEGRLEALSALKWAIRTRVLALALLRRPIGTSAGWCHHWMRELSLRLHPPIPWIGVLGPDGSGKTTVIKAFTEANWLQKKAVCCYHWRPGYIFSRRGDGGPVVDPHAQPPRTAIASTLALGAPVLDWWFGYWLRIVHQRAKTQFVIFDRCFLDLLVDTRRYRYGGPGWLVGALSRIVPQPGILFVLDAPAGVLFARKQEVPEIEVERQRLAYRALASVRKNVYIIDVAKPVDEIVCEMAFVLQANLAGRKQCDIRKAVA